MSQISLEDFARIAQALADENRVRLLLALQGRELCVCQMVELLGLAPSTVSKHLSILKAARLVRSRKDERWMFYGPADPAAPAAVREAVAWTMNALSKDPRIDQDGEKIREILKVDRTELCKKHTGRGSR
jgi:DNA-binding transcriptional ArsR family regulator